VLTGAAVVAVHRAGNAVVLPTGRERLDERDTLARAGPSAALDDDQSLLLSGPVEGPALASPSDSEE
jgi:K+/H+ antiporter YhaU regulatory subunit KhtT